MRELVAFVKALFPAEVKKLGTTRIVDKGSLEMTRVCAEKTNVFGEPIPAAHTCLHGQALDYHAPNVDLINIQMAMDGSVHRQSGRALVILRDSDGKILRIQILVDGNPNELSSYRSEFRAILGGCLLLRRLVPPALRQQAWVNCGQVVNRPWID